MEKKQTAIEWLIEQIDNKDMGEIPIWIYDFCYDALEMEKEQIMDDFQEGKWDWSIHLKDGIESKDPAQYYNETYKSK